MGGGMEVPIRKKLIKWGIIGVALLVAVFAVLVSLGPYIEEMLMDAPMEEVPTATSIKQRSDIAPFLVADTSIRGVYRNMDVDATVFTYQTTVNDADSFWRKVESNIATSKWKLKRTTAAFREYERRFNRGDSSPERPDMAAFASAELLRIALTPAHKVVIACVQADSDTSSVAFAGTDEASWAGRVIWPKFEAEVNRAP